MMSGQRFLVQRDALSQTRVETFDADEPLAPGRVRVRVEQFAFTANNITYAVFGDSLQYWRFFPADAPWGCIPVWGFAVVQASACEGVAAGERLYGYWPMATHAVLQPARVTDNGFADGAAHRAELPPIYNRYLRTARAAGCDAQHEGEYAVLRPLFATAWLIDDFLHEAQDFGARTLLLSSASSKTAAATAFCLKRRAQRRARVVGVTSPSRREFTTSLGVYDAVIGYDGLASLAADEPTVYVDFSGDAPFRRAVHEHWRDALAYSCSVGGTHHEALGAGSGLPGPKPTLFFAPAHMQRHGAALREQLDAAWSEFIARVTDAKAPWLTIERRQGLDAMRAAYLETLQGRADPSRGLMLAF
jgi:Protein of unknown function (DUF2855)